MSVEQSSCPAQVELAVTIDIEFEGKWVEVRQLEEKEKLDGMLAARVAGMESSVHVSDTCDTLSVLASIASEQEIPDFEDFVMEEVPGMSAGQSESSSYKRIVQEAEAAPLALEVAEATGYSNSSSTLADSSASPCREFSNIVPETINAYSQPFSKPEIDNEAGSNAQESAVNTSETAVNTEATPAEKKVRPPSKMSYLRSKSTKPISAYNRKCLNHPRWLNRLL